MSVAHARLVMQGYLRTPEVAEALGGRFSDIWEDPVAFRKFCTVYLGKVPKEIRTLWIREGAWVRGISDKNEGAVGYIEKVTLVHSRVTCQIRVLAPSPRIWLDSNVYKHWEPCQSGPINATRYDLMERLE